MFTTCSSSLQFLKNHIQILWKLLHRGNTSLNSELCSSSVKVPPDSTAGCLMVPLCLLQFTSRPIWKMTSWRRRWKRWESPDAVVWAGGLECRRTDVHLLLHKDQFSFQLQTKSVLFSWDDVKPASTKNVSQPVCVINVLTVVFSVCFQGVDLRQYSKQVESELQRIEQASIKDCILHCQQGFIVPLFHVNLFCVRSCYCYNKLSWMLGLMICCCFPDGSLVRHQGESEHRSAAQPDHRLWLHTGGKTSSWSHNPLHDELSESQ